MYIQKCLSQVGPNFSMMATLFPSRKRKELKSKFKYEEKHHSNLIEIALKASTAPLDSEMFRVLHQMVDEDTKKNSTSTMENTQNHPQQQRKTHHSHIASSPMPMTPMSLGEYDEEYERGRKVSFDFNH
jgi:transcription factor TFIIIB component B''